VYGGPARGRRPGSRCYGCCPHPLRARAPPPLGAWTLHPPAQRGVRRGSAPSLGEPGAGPGHSPRPLRSSGMAAPRLVPVTPPAHGPAPSGGTRGRRRHRAPHAAPGWRLGQARSIRLPRPRCRWGARGGREPAGPRVPGQRRGRGRVCR